MAGLGSLVEVVVGWGGVGGGIGRRIFQGTCQRICQRISMGFSRDLPEDLPGNGQRIFQGLARGSASWLY